MQDREGREASVESRELNLLEERLLHLEDRRRRVQVRRLRADVLGAQAEDWAIKRVLTYLKPKNNVLLDNVTLEMNKLGCSVAKSTVRRVN